MKKIIILLSVLSLLLLNSCNMMIGFGKFSYHHVHVQMYGMTEAVHLDVTSWKDDDGGIELKLVDGHNILLGDGTYMMYDTDECPICGK